MKKEKVLDYCNGDVVPVNDFNYYEIKIWLLPETKTFKVRSWEPVSVPGTEGNSWYYKNITQYFTAAELKEWLYHNGKALDAFMDYADTTRPVIQKIKKRLESELRWY